MTLIADILLVAGALGAGLYCHVLAGRLRRFTDLEKGVGGAVAVLSAQIGRPDPRHRPGPGRGAQAQGNVAGRPDRTGRGRRQEDWNCLSRPCTDLPPPGHGLRMVPRKSRLSARHPFFVRRPAEGAGR